MSIPNGVCLNLKIKKGKLAFLFHWSEFGLYRNIIVAPILPRWNKFKSIFNEIHPSSSNGMDLDYLER